MPRAESYEELIKCTKVLTVDGEKVNADDLHLTRRNAVATTRCIKNRRASTTAMDATMQPLLSTAMYVTGSRAWGKRE